MGRKKKFGECSGFVSVRVPKSKLKEYRDAVRNFVEKKFERDGTSAEDETKTIPKQE